MINVDDLQLNTNIEEVLQVLKREAFKMGKNIFGTFKESGDHLQAPCPFHKNGQEKKPSWGIHTDTGLWHCFTCTDRNSGSLPTLVARILELDGYKAGKEWLIEHFSAIQFINDEAPKLTFGKPEKKKEEKSAPIYITEQELETYRFYHPYMWERKLTKDVVEKFDIGYDKDFKLVLEKDKDGNPTKWSNPIPCLTFPNKDEKGNVVFVARRAVKSKFFWYPEKVEKPLYGLWEVYKYFPNAKEIWVCESMLDALRLWVENIPAVALNGVGSALQMRQLKNSDFKCLILATDNDEAGLKARTNIKNAVRYNGIFIKQALIPKDKKQKKKDINDCTAEEIKNMQFSMIK